MQAAAEAMRCDGRRIVLVPTMGYFHEGHLNLMRVGRKQGDCLAVSLFVNPTQFAPTEDFATYPRDFERDRSLAEEAGADWLFFPDRAEMYPQGFQTTVAVEGVTRHLCGLSRPHFFQGVTTVCMKLFHIIKPHVTVFGRKDFQQYVTIRKMVADMNMGIEVIGVQTTRESDGLAMSSRNVYLNAEERASARCLSRSLLLAKELYEQGERQTGPILTEVHRLISAHAHVKIDYAQICSTSTMENLSRIDQEAVLALAVWVGKTRLIDNHVFGERLSL